MKKQKERKRGTTKPLPFQFLIQNTRASDLLSKVQRRAFAPSPEEPAEAPGPKAVKKKKMLMFKTCDL